jgi:sigma-B regulation protein RsbU (phosphoserine phosphatase)
MNERVLIVDDNDINRKLLNSTLVKTGYQVAEAADGEQALEMAFLFMPDLILLDVMMPKMDGFETCKVLKEDHRTRDIPVIFLSAKSGAEDKIRGLDVGGVDYITKPFDRGEVLARVRNQLKIRSLMQQILRANEELTEKQKRLDEDLKAAAGIQESLLPRRDPGVKNIEFAWRYEACDEIGGDIFNIVRVDEDNLGIYMLDVSGHGVPSALVTVSVHQSLSPQSGFVAKRRLIVPPYYEVVPPREVLRLLDHEYPVERFDKFFTIVYLLLDFKTGLLRYSNAAHPYPFLIRTNGSLEVLDRGGTIIGLDRPVAFEEEEKQLYPGDKVVLFTDGVVECENDRGEFFGEDRLRSVIMELKHEPIGTILDGVITSLTTFTKSGRPQDDISLLGFGFHEWQG